VQAENVHFDVDGEGKVTVFLFTQVPPQVNLRMKYPLPPCFPGLARFASPNCALGALFSLRQSSQSSLKRTWATESPDHKDWL